ncbi:MAG: ribonuclease J [Candidatus Nanopelagicales bacterium]|nr:ribonuclease J [Candidatus Nanopelagicales bacterium]
MTAVAPPDNGVLRLVALGGLGEIGRNMMVLEFNRRMLIIDCGVLFPGDWQPGIDLILPDFEYLDGQWDRVDAIVLTHGHEDHIGALPFLLRHRDDIPIFGSALALAFLGAKLREHRVSADLREVVAGQELSIGDFTVGFMAVTHSIPDAFALSIKTPIHTLLHTGDFKLDQLPLDGRITDLRGFARLGEEGVDLLIVDSTNADVRGFVTSEQEISPVLDQVFSQADGRIIVASFASHVHRIQQVLDCASTHGRRAAFVGRSMVRNMTLALELGYLSVDPGTLVTLDELSGLPDDEVLLVCTGSQGEPMAALSRIANRDHDIEVGPGDTVILASSLIPGNENAVHRVVNGLCRLGARVIHQGNAMVHVSGHASSGELLTVFNVVQPRNVLPVHGEWRHLRANADLAASTGVDPEAIVIADNGSLVDLADGKAKVVGHVSCGYVYVDGSGVGDITESSLKDRRILGEEGFISVFIAVDLAEGKVVAGPELHERGFAEDDHVFSEIQNTVASAVEEALRNGVDDPTQLQQVARRVVGRWVAKTHKRRPMIVPVVVEV